MSCPDNLLYTTSHEWLLIEDDIVTIGVTDFAQKEMTDIVFVELPDVGRDVKKGDAIAVVESVKTAADLYAPVTGEIIEINNTLSDRPELVNEDPYCDAWIVKIKIAGEADREEFLDSEAYTRGIESGDPF